MLDQHLRSHCKTIINTMPIPSPFGLEKFRANTERHRGRPLLLIPTNTTADCSGLWIGTTEGDYIFYERNTTPLHQWHIVGHEIGHMLFGHRGTPISDDEFARLLFPNLDPDLVQSALARSAYTDTEEEEAETFATLLLDHIHRLPHPPDLPPGKAEVLTRLEGAFTASARRGE
jgi:hypothetical protein